MLSNIGKVVLGGIGCVLASEDFPDLDFYDELLMEDFADFDEPKDSVHKNARRDFDEFDVNRDGQVDALEVPSRFHVNAIDMFYFFTQADKDLSGTVSFPEYVGYIEFATGGSKKST